MGVVVLGTAVARPTSSPFSHGARRVADAAARQCLTAAGRTAGDVDLLVNVGIYRERGLGEPALAALIQEDVGANPHGNDGFGHGTFSFDVTNGACGVLTGVDVVRGFLLSGTAEVGLVVTSDSAPGPTHVRDVPHPEAGAALLLGTDDDVEGFSGVRLATFPEYADLIEGYWEWRPHRRPLARLGGTPHLVVLERPGFAARAVDCAEDTVTRFLAESGVAASDIDLLVATPQNDFADGLADRLGIPHVRTLHAGEQIARMHTAQTAAAVDLARHNGRWDDARTILLVSAGAGITIAAALYRH